MSAAGKKGRARAKMPEQPATLRATSFGEVNVGLEEAQAIAEAERCIKCKKPACVEGCPVCVDIPGFLGAVAQGDLRGAAITLGTSNVLPGITGRVCPQETQCEAKCILAKKGESVAIGHLERFVADWAAKHPSSTMPANKNASKRVAVVGSGPAGLTCAGELARLGYEVTIFEALHSAGGVLSYGIPEFRLPKCIVDREVNELKQLGVKIECNVVVGQTYTVGELLDEEGFSSVFIANGAGLPKFLGIPGEHLKGVYSANEYLTRVNLMGAYRNLSETPILRGTAVVCGGGNTAMDAVRTARRLGSNPSTLVYRRSEEEMPARREEVHHAKEEGIEFHLLTNPVAILGDEKGCVKALRCQRMGLGAPDDSGRRRPMPIEGSEFEIPCKIFIEAVGTSANPLLTQTTPELKLDRWGQIVVNEAGMTSMPGVFAGGDIVRGGATVILAMGDGKRAAAAMHDFMSTGRGPERSQLNSATAAVAE